MSILILLIPALVDRTSANAWFYKHILITSRKTFSFEVILALMPWKLGKVGGSGAIGRVVVCTSIMPELPTHLVQALNVGTVSHIYLSGHW